MRLIVFSSIYEDEVFHHEGHLGNIATVHSWFVPLPPPSLLPYVCVCGNNICLFILRVWLFYHFLSHVAAPEFARCTHPRHAQQPRQKPEHLQTHPLTHTHTRATLAYSIWIIEQGIIAAALVFFFKFLGGKELCSLFNRCHLISWVLFFF